MKLALQTYTIRRESKIDFPSSLKQIASLGIGYVELARIPFSEDSVNHLHHQGIKVVSIQEKFHKLKKYPKKYQEFCKRVDCDIVCISVIPLACIIGKERPMKRFIKQVNELAVIYKEMNLRLAIHHHDFEFKKIHDQTKLEILIKQTSKDVSFVMDTYWVQKSGYDVLEVLKWFGPKLIGLHLRDCMITKSKSMDTFLGNGLIDFEKLLLQIPASVVYGAIEQNTMKPYEDILQSMQTILPLLERIKQ
jgi:sugar phosphate isomerase/epimerase